MSILDFLIAHPPHLSVSELARLLNGRSAHVLRREFPRLRRVNPHHLWSPSYYAASVGGAPIDVLRRYIENQDRPEWITSGRPASVGPL